MITNSLEIKCKFPYLVGHNAVSDWMTSAPGSLPDYSAFLRFSNVNSPFLFTDVYGVTFEDKDNNVAPAVGVNDSLLVRKELHAFYGSIKSLMVPTQLQVNWVEGFSNSDLIIHPKVGQKIILDGDAQINGTLAGNGGGNIAFGGGVVENPIKVKQQPDFFTVEIARNNGVDMLRDWMYYGDPGQWIQYPSDIRSTLISGSTGITFFDPLGNHAELYAMVRGTYERNNDGSIKHDANGNPIIATAGTTGICVNQHLWVRKDMCVRGMIDSTEGIFVAHSGPRNIGWGPYGKYDSVNNPNPKRTPMLLIADDEMPGNPSPDTWEVRKMKLDGTWPWVNFEANDLISNNDVIGRRDILAHRDLFCYRNVYLNAVRKQHTAWDNIFVWDTIAPPAEAQANGREVNLGTPQCPWDNLYVKSLHVIGGNGAGDMRCGEGKTEQQSSTPGTTTITFTPFPVGVIPRITCTVKSVEIRMGLGHTENLIVDDPVVISVRTSYA